MNKLLSMVFLLAAIQFGLFAQDLFAHQDAREERLNRLADKRLEAMEDFFLPYRNIGRIIIDSTIIQRHNKHLTIYFSPTLTHLPIREPFILALETEIRNNLGRRFRGYSIAMETRNRPVKDFIPNLYRIESFPQDTLRVRNWPEQTPLVTSLTKPTFTGGLQNNHIALWHSHGLYYNAEKDRWEWQRARLFATVEDIFPMDYVLNFITPMLENAGANVLIPRERDYQVNEVIVDNDQSTGNSAIVLHHGDTQWETANGGYAFADTLFDGMNPFRMGSFLFAESNRNATLTYIPEIPEDGHYAVYLSWGNTPDNVPDVPVTVNYSGGQVHFLVNQQMGSGTWVYLGNFYFEKGKDSLKGSLTVNTLSAFSGVITADAVKFGGGMGKVARRPHPDQLPRKLSANDRGRIDTENQPSAAPHQEISWKLSGRPAFMEGARYYLQTAGMDFSMVYSPNEGKNDYNDDFMSRGEWVNYLMGSPLGPEKDRDATGLSIPIDLSFAFHTDAGITPNDSVIGTLAIYSAQRENGIFPDGVSKLASRDLTDIIQSQIVDDIRALHNPLWTRRAIWDRQYSEAWRPNVPAMLLELLSHQNLADMRYGMDPEFQFDVSRAIYKGILRFISQQEGREAIVQPLPPKNFAMEKTGSKTITLHWLPTHDPLEATASPDYYKVYTRLEGQGFDQGVIVEGNQIEITLPQFGTIYSFKVTAVNAGGESFPSEILSASFTEDNTNIVLIVNAFNRISGPGTFSTENHAGNSWWDDHPIPYKHSASFTGQQYDFDRSSPWLDDDSPGWGASFANMEGILVAGNTFDFPFIHGKAIRNAGYSFISVSRDAFENGNISTRDFFMINIILGKQKGIQTLNPSDSIRFRAWTPQLMAKLTEYLDAGGRLFVSGAYTGTDAVMHKDTMAINFAKDKLGFTWRTNNACNGGTVHITDQSTGFFPDRLAFSTYPNTNIYHVEAPDALEPACEGCQTVFRFSTNATSAAVWKKEAPSVFSMGFPFETILCQQERDALMKMVLKALHENP